MIRINLFLKKLLNIVENISAWWQLRQSIQEFVAHAVVRFSGPHFMHYDGDLEGKEEGKVRGHARAS